MHNQKSSKTTPVDTKGGEIHSLLRSFIRRENKKKNVKGKMFIVYILHFLKLNIFILSFISLLCCLRNLNYFLWYHLCPFILFILVNCRWQRALVLFTNALFTARASFLKWLTFNRHILRAVSYFHHHVNEL